MVVINDVELKFLGHAGFMISCKEGKKIVIDPYNVSEEVSREKADIILITHSHYDHCSIRDIEKFTDQRSTIVVPADCQSKITKIEGVDMQIMEVGDEIEFGKVRIEALPAYNIESDVHPKREGWLGYLIKVNGVVVYHTGDSDKIPEMKRLTGHGKHGTEFIALLPISGKAVMDIEEAVEVASLLSPDLAIPMSYGAGVTGTLEDARNFVKMCDEINIKAQILEKVQ